MLAVVVTRGVSGLSEFAGITWAFLQYVVGLERLGIETYWVDLLPPMDPRRAARNGRPRPDEDCHSPELAAQRFERLAQRFGFAERYCILSGEGSFGLSRT